MKKHYRKIILLAAASMLLIACASKESRVGGLLNLKTNLKVDFKVAANVNPDEANKASPVFVKFYQLKSAKLFEDANFIDLYENDEEILADSLISKTELEPLLPGKERTEKYVLDKETQYIGMMAEFFKYNDSKYKVIFPVTKNNVFKNAVTVSLTSNQMLLED